MTDAVILLDIGEMYQLNLSISMGTSENDGRDEHHSAERSSSLRPSLSYQEEKFCNTFNSIEDWAFDEYDSKDTGFEVEQTIIEWNETIKNADSLESLENWTFDDDDSKEDSGYEEELDFKQIPKSQQNTKIQVQSSVLVR